MKSRYRRLEVCLLETGRVEVRHEGPTGRLARATPLEIEPVVEQISGSLAIQVREVEETCETFHFKETDRLHDKL